MPNSFVQAEWEDLCQRTQRTAEYFGCDAPELADSFQQQAEAFSRKNAPDRYPELLDRVRSAANLAKRWQQQSQPDEDHSDDGDPPEAVPEAPTARRKPSTRSWMNRFPPAIRRLGQHPRYDGPV